MFYMVTEEFWGIIFSVILFVILHFSKISTKIELSDMQIKIKKPSINKIVYMTDVTHVKIEEIKAQRHHSIICAIKYMNNEIEETIHIDLKILSDKDSFVNHLRGICVKNKIAIENNHKFDKMYNADIWKRNKKKAKWKKNKKKK